MRWIALKTTTVAYFTFLMYIYALDVITLVEYGPNCTNMSSPYIYTHTQLMWALEFFFHWNKKCLEYTLLSGTIGK